MAYYPIYESSDTTFPVRRNRVCIDRCNQTYDRLAAFPSADEAARLEAFIAANPESGDLIPGTGGIRKLRWAASGRGKRGGARIIYYFHSPAMILFLLAAYTKATKIDLTGVEKKQFRKLTEHLKNQYT